MTKLILAITIAVCGPSILSAAIIDVTKAPNTVKCDGTTDDTAAIQVANDNASPGDLLLFPSNSTCILSTETQTPGGSWYNVVTKGGRTFLGFNTTFKQAASGRHSTGTGRNVLLAVGKAWDNPPSYPCQANYYPLNATTVGSNTVTLTNSGDAANFNVGDIFVVYNKNPNPSTNPCTSFGTSNACPDVCTSAVVSTVSAKTCTGTPTVCTLTLTGTDTVQRAFSTPFIGNVTNATAINVGVQGIVLQGQESVSISEVYNASFQNVQFISDVAGQADQMNANTCSHCSIIGSVIDNIAPNGYTFNEAFQRNSYFSSIKNSTINTTAFGWAESGGGNTVTGSTINCYVDTTQFGCVGIELAGSTFSNNLINTIGNLTGTDQYVLGDANTPDITPYGSNNYSNNTINCRADGNSCVVLKTNNNTFTNNTVPIVGTASFLTDNGTGNTTTPNTYGTATTTLTSVTLDAASSVQSFSNSAGTVTWTHTASGPDRYGIVVIGAYDGGGDPSSVTWGGTAMTLLGSQDFSDDSSEVWIYGLASPPTGNQTISITMNSQPGAAMSLSYTNVNQTTSTGTPSGSTAIGASVTSPSVATASGDMTLAAFGSCWFAAPVSVSSPATIRGSAVGVSTTCGAGSADSSGTGGNVSVGWQNADSTQGANWAMLTVDLKHQ